jgi:hypothetical protein
MDPAAEAYYSWSPYNYVGGNPIKRVDTDGMFWDAVIDAAFILYDVGEMAYDYATTGSVSAVSTAALSADLVSLAIPFATGGGLGVRLGAEATEQVAKQVTKEVASEAGEKVVKEAAQEGGEKATRMVENAKTGKDFEKKVAGTLDGPKAEQVTIEAADGTRTKVDFVQNKGGQVSLTEAKGSATAPLTKNQKSAHPQISESGGTVRGNKGQDIGLPAGTKIPPTNVEIVRP